MKFEMANWPPGFAWGPIGLLIRRNYALTFFAILATVLAKVVI
jgi:hypothetical protein